MGLDSIVYLKTRTPIQEEDVPHYTRVLSSKRVVEDEQGKPSYQYELSYFRKCWSIHDIMMSLDNAVDGFSFEGGCESLEKYADGLIDQLKNPELFESESQVFTISEELDQICHGILNCRWASEYIKTHGDSYAVFVDSY